MSHSVSESIPSHLFLYLFLLQVGLHPLPEEVPHWLLMGGGLHAAAIAVLVVAVVVAAPTLPLVASRTGT